jgi:HK97 gp10 family phage protein
MISLNWGQMDGEIGALMKRFDELPRHIAKKHLKAAMKRAGQEAVKVLKANTPVGGGRRVKAAVVRGELKMNYKRRGGSLRRASTFVSKYIGRNKDGLVVGVVGYKYGFESRKAIWLEFGTSRGIEPRQIIDKTLAASRSRVLARLESEMVKALDKAQNELAADINPGMSKRGLAAGVAPR